MLNKHMIIGRLGQDPEVRHLDSGAKVANFSIASNERFKKNGETVEETEWHNVAAWDKLAEITEQFLKKGDLVFISGKSVTRSWEKEGVTRYRVEIVARELQMLGNKENPQSTPSMSGNVVDDITF